MNEVIEQKVNVVEAKDLEMMEMSRKVLTWQNGKIEELTKLLSIAQPKAEVCDKISESGTLIDIQTAAQTISMKNIFKVLVADRVFEEKFTYEGQKYYKPYSQYSQYFSLKDKVWTTPDRKEHIRPRIYVTGKGMIWLTKRYAVEESI